MNEILNSASEYTNKLLKLIESINTKNYYIDHIAYRVSWGEKGEGDYSKYVSLRSSLISNGAEIISEEIVPNNENGRPISIFRLKNKLISKLNDIEYFELPAPRIGKQEGEGFTHIEIVIDESLNDFYNSNSDFIRSWSIASDVTTALDNEKLGKFGNHEIELDFDNNQKIKFHKVPIWEYLKIQYQNTPKETVTNNRKVFSSKFPNILN